MTLKQHADLLVAQGALIEAQWKAHLEAVARFCALVTEDAPPAGADTGICTEKEVRSLRTMGAPSRYQCAAGHIHGEEEKTTPAAAPEKE